MSFIPNNACKLLFFKALVAGSTPLPTTPPISPSPTTKPCITAVNLLAAFSYSSASSSGTVKKSKTGLAISNLFSIKSKKLAS